MRPYTRLVLILAMAALGSTACQGSLQPFSDTGSEACAAGEACSGDADFEASRTDYICGNGVTCDGQAVTGAPRQVICGTDLVNYSCTRFGWRRLNTSCTCDVSPTPTPTPTPAPTPTPTPTPAPTPSPTPSPAPTPTPTPTPTPMPTPAPIGACAPVIPPATGRVLYVDAASGNDSYTYAQNSAATPWRSIGRAAWGSSNRAAPNASEAARAGDRVNVASGTYTFDGTVSNRFMPVYLPANDGTSSSPIVFACAGRCVLTAPFALSPVIGNGGRDHIRWFADIGQGHAWVINACGYMNSACPSNTVKTRADTGPVVCNGGTGCWIEGALIDGGPLTDYTDNWNGVRLENTIGAVVRNNEIRNF
ncbi:MAG TPA: hypothetical protein VFV50_05875, partial [Bdellovibrionales bacterium]|nr:hypothetical protein [Bdellovibrionales bacterium]